MVTLLKPNTTESNAGSLEVTVQDEGTQSGNNERVLGLGATVTAPRKTQHNAGFISGIAHPLLALHELLSDPAMTQRDRHRREAGQAAIRDTASLVWFGRTPWF